MKNKDREKEKIEKTDAEAAALSALSNKSLIGFVLPLIIFITLGIFFYQSSLNTLSRTHWVGHTFEVLGTLNDTLLSIIDIETGGRGYVITGEESWMEPYNTGVVLYQQHLKNLRELTKNNPSQQKRLDSLDNLCAEKVDFMKHIAGVRREQGFEAAQKIIMTRKGKQLMDDIRKCIKEMKDEEDRLMEERRSAEKAGWQDTKAISLFGTLFACLLLGVISLFIYRVAASDLLKRYQMEKSLEQASLYARSLIESSLDPLVTISKDGKIMDVNEATIKATGISKEKLIGTDFASYFTEPEKAQAGYQEVFTKGFVSDYPLTIRHKDGKLADVLYNATVYTRDVTEFNNLQNKLLRSEKLAIVGKLAASVAHELRNPLGVMKNTTYYLNMLELTKDSPELKENLDVINHEIENSDRIIGDLLEFSRAKESVFLPENINVIVKEILDRLRVSPNIELVLELKDGLPQIEVDALQMHQVFYNLVKNATEAMEKGGKLTIRTGLKEGAFVEVSISDTGSGISKENIVKIFDPLFSTKTKGTGLGLSVCSSLIERHNGSIDVDSEVGKGTTFTVKLPIRRG
ncbi:MAG: CHASE3 domain-containing protein [Proteobacteria bacterium]|nr:CHASE3 domain-containing protein [Pseudomonadota bacterium]